MIYVRNSDKHIGRNIYLSAGALYSKRKRNTTLEIATLVNRSLNQFRKYLDFPKDIKIRIAPIKGTLNGRYSSGSRTVEIKCTLSWAKALEVLAHELVHAEQYKQGRLKQSYITGRGWVHSWNGDKINNKGTTYKAYRNQPWEQEAWARQAELAEKVCSDLEKIYE